MAFSKIIAESMDLTDTYAFTGTVTGAGGITQADLWRTTSGISSGSTATVISTNLERADDTMAGLIGSGMSQSSGVFTFPQTGIYEVTFNAQYYKEGDSRYVAGRIEATANNSTYENVAENLAHIEQSYSLTHQNVISHALIDVTDTSNVKVRFLHRVEASSTLNANDDYNATYMKFIRLGDT